MPAKIGGKQALLHLRGKEGHLPGVTFEQRKEGTGRNPLQAVPQITQAGRAEAGKVAGEVHQSPAQPPGQQPQPAIELNSLVLSIAGEKFVAALAAQGHRHPAPGRLGQQVGGDDGGVGQGFVQVPEELGQQVGGRGRQAEGLVAWSPDIG